MSSTDYYTTLGVPKGASQEEIKKAYRKLAHQHHPDKSGGNEAKFKELNQAYQVLSDPKKRQQYDQFGPSFAQGGFGGQSSQGGQGFGGFDFGQGGINFENMEDIFEMFGGAFGGRARQKEDLSRGHDLELALEVDFADSIRGASRKIEFNSEMVCPTCEGNGAQKGSKLRQCEKCKGSGQLRQNVSSLFGPIARVVTCDNCQGTGQVPEKACKTCGGSGRSKEKQSMTLDIPAGIRSGESLVLRGKGQAGLRGGKAGDLFVHIRAKSDKRFVRLGNDIIMDLPVKITDALLGAKINVPTLDGEKEVEIPAGVQEGEEVRLKGLGVRGSRSGDQVLKIKIQVPKHLSGKAKELVEELSNEI